MKMRMLIAVVLVLLAALAYLCYGPVLGDCGVFGHPAAGRSPAASLPVVPSERELIFSADPWVPYTGMAGSSNEGYMVDMLREIYEPLGYRVRFVNLPWSRCIQDTRDGQMTAILGAHVPEAPDFVFPEESAGVTRPMLFVDGTSEWRFAGFSSLSNITLGVVQDYSYSLALDDYIRLNRETPRILTVGGDAPLNRLLLAVHAGHITAFVENAIVVRQTLAELGLPLTLVREAGSPGPGLRVCVAFSPRSPQSPELAKVFDKGIRELRANGRLKAILDRYGVEDWLATVEETERVR